MTEITINTAQNVAINFKAASLGERILAFAVDEAIKTAYAITIPKFKTHAKRVKIHWL